jgi:hypothetical protein
MAFKAGLLEDRLDNGRKLKISFFPIDAVNVASCPEATMKADESDSRLIA